MFDTGGDEQGPVGTTTTGPKERMRKGLRPKPGRYTVHVRPVLGKKRMAGVANNDARSLSAALDDEVQAEVIH